MKRRAFIRLLGSAATVWPLAAIAQQRMHIVGALMGVAEHDPEAKAWVSAFQSGLRERGWIGGQNVQIIYRWPAGDTAVMMSQAQELVSLQPDVILTHASPATAAVRKATTSIPNVFVVVSDPVGSGFVSSFPRPNGNSTGFTNFASTIGGKWLELLKEIKPQLKRVAMLFNPDTTPAGARGIHLLSIQEAAPSVNITAIASPFGNAVDIEHAFTEIAGDQSGLIVIPDTSTTLHSRLIVELAARHQTPAIYPYRDFVALGGLLSYGVDRADLYRRAALYIDRILNGEKPANLPVQSPTKYEMAVNLKAARELGLSIPQTLLGTADEVIE
jgi:putative tryptophan/tyrosine transport system substrate-binding protein